ncbi:MAG: hypothetical protein ACYTJ0_13835 [Planctomycetota bacterium]
MWRVLLVATAAAIAVAAFALREPPAADGEATKAEAPPPAVEESATELADWLDRLDETADELVGGPGRSVRLRNPFSLNGHTGDFVAEVDEPAIVEASPPPAEMSSDGSRWWQRAEWAADALELESVMIGREPLITMNGSILRVGDSVNVEGVEFVVLQIETRSAVLATESHELGFTLGEGTAYEIRLTLDG